VDKGIKKQNPLQFYCAGFVLWPGIKKILNISITREEHRDTECDRINNFLDFALTDEYETRDKIPFKVKENFDRYYKHNYESIKEECDKQLMEKHDIHQSILFMKVCNSKEDAGEFVKRYQDTFQNVGDINVAKTGVLTVIAPINQNKERVKFYETERTIISDMIKHNEEYNKLAPTLNNYRRIKQGRDKNKNNSENISEQLEEYITTFSQQEGVTNYDELQDKLKQCLTVDENNVDVPFHVIKPKIDPQKPIQRGNSSRYIMRL